VIIKETISAYNIFGPKYKILGIQIQTSFTLDQYQRQTYDLLNFMGDVGGRDGILCSIAIVCINKYNTLALKSVLL
jgi:hypothetical protein